MIRAAEFSLTRRHLARDRQRIDAVRDHRAPEPQVRLCERIGGHVSGRPDLSVERSGGPERLLDLIDAQISGVAFLRERAGERGLARSG